LLGRGFEIVKYLDRYHLGPVRNGLRDRHHLADEHAAGSLLKIDLVAVGHCDQQILVAQVLTVC
jgi:hypothetical protein